MEFFDCNVIYGLPSERKPTMPVPDIGAVRVEMKRAGIGRALVRREEQICTGAILGNRLVAEDVKDATDLWGVWAILPSHTHELQEPNEMPAAMKANRIAAWQFLPNIHGYSFHPRVLGDWFALARERSIPLLVDLAAGIADRDLFDVLEAFPELKVVISLNTVWPSDRRIRPFLKEFPNCCIELSNYFGDGTLESLVGEYGSRRILFGSGFYRNHFGGYMLMLKHAQISEEDKRNIAGANLERLIAGVDYD
jgi:predicted TIM-barrel fold metal-dependent hydrolase